MQILWFRITPVISTVCFTLAFIAIVSTAKAGQTPGTVTGTVSVTTPDNTTEPWPGDPKPHYLMRADQTYTGSYSVAVIGKFDPHGALLGIRRFYQIRTPGTYNLGPMSELTVSTTDRPANSGFAPGHNPASFGPYQPNQATYLTTNAVANDTYGVETAELIYVDSSNNQHVLDYQCIDIYGPKSGNSATYNVQAFPGTMHNNAPGSALNTDTTKPYLGDPPRVTLTTSDTIYPGATFWIVIYPGAAQTTPPSNAKTIGTWTAPTGDNTSLQTLTNNNYFIDIGNKVTGAGTYTVQAMQKSTSNSFGTETFGQRASFSIKTNYNVTSQLGLEK